MLKNPKNYLILFYLLLVGHAHSQTVINHNLKVTKNNQIQSIDVDGNFQNDINFILDAYPIDINLMLAETNQDTTFISQPTSDGINFNYYTNNPFSTTFGFTTIGCFQWVGFNGMGSNNVNYVQFYKKISPTDSIFGYVKYIPFVGPLISDCDDDTIFILQSVYADTVNMPINPSGFCDYDFNVIKGASCEDECTGEVGVTAITAFPPLTYAWSNGETTNVIDSLCPAVYSLTITDGAGCVWQDSIEIDSSSLENNFFISGNYIPPCGLSLTSFPVGTYPATYTYSWSNGSTSNPITNLCDDTYIVTATDQYDCSVSDTITIYNDSLLATLHPNYYQPAGGPCGETICNGQFAIFINNGTAPYTISLSNGDAYSTSNNYLIADSLCAGLYNYTVTDAAGATFTNNVFISATTALNIDTVQTLQNIICNGGLTGIVGVIVSDGTGPYNYQVDANGFQNSNVFQSLGAGNHSAIVMDQNGCSDTASFSLSEPLAITLSSLSKGSCGPICAGSIKISAYGVIGPYTYSFDNGFTYQSSNMQTGLCPGIYNLIVKDGNSCLNTLTDTVIGAPALTMLPSVSQPSCAGTASGSINVNPAGGSAPYLISLDLGAYQSFGNYPSVSAGTHQIELVDNIGCKLVQSVTLIQPSNYFLFNFVASNPTSACGANDGSFEILANGFPAAPPYFYSIDGGVNIQINNGLFTNLSAGIYWFTVVDGNGCADSVQVTISDSPLSTQIDAVMDPTCGNSCDGYAEVSATSSAAPFSYTVDYDTTNYPTGIFNSLCGSQHFIGVHDNNGCSAYEEINLNVLPLITFTTSSVSPTCLGVNDAQITVNNAAGGDGGPYSYSIDGVNFQTSNVFNGLSYGSHPVYVKDAGGCQVFINTYIQNTLNPMILGANSGNVLCNGDNSGFVNLLAVQGTGPYSYDFGGSITSNGTYSNLGPGNYSFTVTDANGCSLDTTFTLTEPPLLVLNSTLGADPDCNGGIQGSISMDASGDSPYLLYSVDGGGTLFSFDSIPFLGAGSYTAMIEDVNGCSQSMSITLEDPLAMLIDTMNVIKEVCSGDCNGKADMVITNGQSPYTISASSGSFSWITMNQFQLDSICSGTINVLAIDDLGCASNYTFNLGIQGNILVDTMNYISSACFNDCEGIVDIQVSGGSGPYLLNSTSGTILTIGPGQFQLDSICDGTIQLILTDNNGCIQNQSFAFSQPDSMYFVYNQTGIATCTACTDGAAEVTIFGGVGPFIIDWSSFNSTDTDTSASNLLGGTGLLCITDANGCQFCDSVTVNFIDDIGFSEYGIDFNLYPNPAQNSISIVSSIEVSELEITDARGKVVLALNLNTHNSEIDLSKLPDGVYMLRAFADGQIVIRRLVIL